MGNTAKKKEKWIKHYSSKHQILLVGEGDFSFALSLAKAFRSAANITATSLNSRREVFVHYSKGIDNLNELETYGCTIIHKVNVHTMNEHPRLRGKQFDRIVFNFPHAGFEIPHKEWLSETIKANQSVVKGFLGSAREMVRGCNIGEIHITHKTGFPYDMWEIETLAEEEGLQLLGKVPFSRSDYPGYINKKGEGVHCGKTFRVGECSTFKFAPLTD